MAGPGLAVPAHAAGRWSARPMSGFRAGRNGKATGAILGGEDGPVVLLGADKRTCSDSATRTVS